MPYQQHTESEHCIGTENAVNRPHHGAVLNLKETNKNYFLSFNKIVGQISGIIYSWYELHEILENTQQKCAETIWKT